ncbi:MAG: WecB/TagA/CpsF family glycosyltransferase [Acidobacteria bacterium]|nr:WecB/TagA/CpsF family glycosyltransferase [Acidobacteriota bacterium]
MTEAVGRIRSFATGSQNGLEPIVITPNTDIVVQLEDVCNSNSEFHERLASAFLILPDGFPILMASRLLDGKLQSVIPGADLMAKLFESSDAERVIVVAPDAITAARLILYAEKNSDLILRTIVPGDLVAGSEGFGIFVQQLVDDIQSFSPAYVMVCLGFPKQERLSLAAIDCLKSKGEMAVPLFFGLGASAEFLAGTKKRAPKWMRKIHMEWFHRMVHEPRRLIRRYLKDAIFFVPIVWREWLGRTKSK